MITVTKVQTYQQNQKNKNWLTTPHSQECKRTKPKLNKQTKKNKQKTTRRSTQSQKTQKTRIRMKKEKKMIPSNMRYTMIKIKSKTHSKSNKKMSFKIFMKRDLISRRSRKFKKHRIDSIYQTGLQKPKKMELPIKKRKGKRLLMIMKLKMSWRK